MMDAKLKGEGFQAEESAEPDRSNVIDLMSALRKSLQAGDEAGETSASATPAEGKQPAEPAPEAKNSKKPKAAAQAATKSPRRRA